jgi:hypothetical protein
MYDRQSLKTIVGGFYKRAGSTDRVIQLGKAKHSSDQSYLPALNGMLGGEKVTTPGFIGITGLYPYDAIRAQKPVDVMHGAAHGNISRRLADDLR